jgi:RimJ/RimL family protein N-acetyltransferase
MDGRTAPPELRTPRLTMRVWRAEDREPFAALNRDPEVMRYIGSGLLDARASDDMRARLRDEWERAGHGLWALQRTDDPTLLGFCGLTRPAWGGRSVAGEVEVGWRLARDAWGHGFATEAARAALEVAWGPLGLSRVISLVHPENARSLAVCERLGMRVVGRAVHPPTRWRLLVLRAERPGDVAPRPSEEPRGAAPPAPPAPSAADSPSRRDAPDEPA